MKSAPACRDGLCPFRARCDAKSASYFSRTDSLGGFVRFFFVLVEKQGVAYFDISAPMLSLVTLQGGSCYFTTYAGGVYSQMSQLEI
jgi:hypothetical protein